jgi:hypothetical protein
MWPGLGGTQDHSLREVGTSRRSLTIVIAVIAGLVLLSPFIAGYFGPTAATYAQTWLPWRSHLGVQEEGWGPVEPTSGHAFVVATYSDPWPGTGRSPGHQTVFVTLSRPNVLLPWVVTERGTGP